MLLRNVLLVIHIIAAGFWIAQLPVEMYFRRQQREAKGTADELQSLLTQINVQGVLGQFGGMGILLSGLGLIAVEGLGFLGIGAPTPTWLVIKQVIYIILLVTVFALIRPQSERILAALRQAAQGSDGVTAEISDLAARFGMISTLHSVLVLVNIVLAVWKMPQ